MSSPPSEPNEELDRVLQSARRLGVEMNEADALSWLTTMADSRADSGIVTDARTGVFGHKISMLDFSDADLEHFRTLGRIVEFADVPGVVETALALSGSAAQSKFQTFPGDADFFERVNILAESRDAACKILADLIRAKTEQAGRGSTYLMIAVRFGSYPMDVVRAGKPKAKGDSIEWSPQDIAAGQFDANLPDGQAVVIRWEDAMVEPGWCKLDWVIADAVRGHVVNASNMLDVTWEAPDGTITPLDGYLDPYFQEIYLEAESAPIFAKLAQHVSADALDEYVAQLEHEVDKYVTTDINYGKAAKRMYNVFRLTGRYEDAIFIRELFDEPASMLYQVWSLFRTMEECCAPGSTIAIESVRAQADQLILSVVQSLEGAEETAVIKHLLVLRDALDTQESGQRMHADVEAARAEVINLVNNFFYEKLNALPSIKVYIDEIQAEPEG
ncbi:MAG: hypothetical protein MUO25_03130 [Thermoanaerobaculaceae bacterium]|nr:hypothetical protein [Thermoanaerobaculaceae bacterium]